MSSHILIFGGFITSLLDDKHVILGHIPYPPRSSGICLFVHTIVIERMSLVMTFSRFHHVLIDATLGHICQDHLDVFVCVDKFLLRCRAIF